MSDTWSSMVKQSRQRSSVPALWFPGWSYDDLTVLDGNFREIFSSSRFGELQWFLCQAEVVTAGLNGIGFWSTAMVLTLFMVWEGLRLEKERLQSTMPPPSWLRFESSKLDVFDWWSGEVDKSCLWLTHILEEIGKFFHLYSYKDLQTIITFRCSRVLVALSLFDPTSSPSGFFGCRSWVLFAAYSQLDAPSFQRQDVEKATLRTKGKAKMRRE